MKANRLLTTDLLLLIVFIAVAISGFGVHIMGHKDDHLTWHHWAVTHTLATLLFIIATIVHIYLHKNWYKGLCTKQLGNKSKVTIFITFLFVILTITGILAFVIPIGPNSEIGLMHYKIGIVSTPFLIGHIIKRHNFLVKGIIKKRK